jgi:hypothetical protein
MEGRMERRHGGMEELDGGQAVIDGGRRGREERRCKREI